MEPTFNKMTPAGYHAIEQEIEDLKQQRPHRIKVLAAAAALGDRSENAEYTNAKRDLGRLESRLRFLNKQLQYAQVVEPADNDQLDIGKSVTLEFLDDHDQVTYQLVGKQEANLADQKISFTSPIGKALTGHTTNDIVTVTAPNGNYQVKIIDIHRH
ncbi:transcription elongation factor GreA [Lactiplantibacillus mudanjiangensis]|uniref:Transcription elongation factor GreA n=1 Tax=Lactiplantibacillus mudanjiangensis TaxID=1296538 RepID=A0A660E809_9LACO|nr:transcription elongation factor GreA [Lactiplantibacillus mudanjiangensis]VDG21145.1 transcription elongation factor GreA [Lactobacillus sp.] [Lactiplantibacillus mudanjiangensis]VDG22919.1 transcription elongation factor GreA [Lactobacillus sp.] [Lactiplantibacillus mudanjiangensis]VDG29221.1 transcription elongation factor GreA [Lactobacillus sp.] [Lactiplantibacillus mudanjiangensis]VDG31748.1 transcription elongation factor GreA [Lactobacillus sp.] [Lactiplantibacillus mudanjiangensis]